MSEILSGIRAPTDNLYKFIAIGGIVLIGYAVFQWSTVSESLDNEYRNYREMSIQSDIRVAEIAQMRWLEGDLDVEEFSLENEEFILSTRGLSLLEPDSARSLEDVKALVRAQISAERVDRLRQEIAAYTNRLAATDAPSREAVAALGREHEERKQVFARQLHFVKWFVAIGAAISLAGFILWWFCFQRFQDIILRSEATKAGDARPKYMP